mmetsp:Transcript_40640/g.105495  ORF Transcript_40640/g.105495 Transcript_40640/m.105495 type:complete len:248 (-) Transcript_40640:1142-1885(-)
MGAGCGKGSSQSVQFSNVEQQNQKKRQEGKPPVEKATQPQKEGTTQRVEKDAAEQKVASSATSANGTKKEGISKEPKENGTGGPERKMPSVQTPEGAARRRHSFSEAKAKDRNVIKTGKLREHYDVYQVLGAGSFSTVKLVEKRASSELFAAKIIDKTKTTGENAIILDEVWREIDVLRSLDHPNIVRLHEVYDEPKKLYIVMDYASGGELFERLVQRKRYSEADAAAALHDVVSGIAYLHSKVDLY